MKSCRETLRLPLCTYKNRGGVNQITTSFSLPLPVCPELPVPSNHFSSAAAVPWSPHCRRLLALSYPAPPALHPSHCIIRAEPPQLACLSRESALTTRVLAIQSLPRLEPTLPWLWFISVPCLALGFRVSLD